MAYCKAFYFLVNTFSEEQDICRKSSKFQDSAFNQQMRNHVPSCSSGCGQDGLSFGAFYRIFAARVGKAKAVTAKARKLAVIFYNTLRYGTKFVDPSAEYYEEKYRERVINHMAKKAKKLAFEFWELVPP